MKSYNKNFPIIFIHYGNTEYLKYTIQFAKYYNPEKEVIILGDNNNMYLKRYGISHYFIEDYSQSKEIDTFHQVFKVIGREDFEIKGKDNGKSTDDKGIFWLKFVFLKMFILYNFISKHGLSSFWTFDTDNLIVSDLSSFEKQFSQYDNTELNEGMSMHGFINNIEVLKKYINAINELFEDDIYLERQRQELLHLPKHFSYTEMRAYVETKRRYQFKSLYLCSNERDYVFDNKMVNSDGMELRNYNHALFKQIKKVYTDQNGNFYFKSLIDGKLIKVISFDCSWLPTCVFAILNQYRKLKRKNSNQFKEIIFYEPLYFRVKRFIEFYKKKVYH